MNNLALQNSNFKIELAEDSLAVSLKDMRTGIEWSSNAFVKMIYGNQYAYDLIEYCDKEISKTDKKITIKFSNMVFWSRFKKNGYIKPNPGPDLKFEFSIILKDDLVVFRVEPIEGLDEEECLISFPDGMFEFESRKHVQLVIPCAYGTLIEFPRKDHWSFNYETGHHYTNLPVQGIFTEEGGAALYLKTPFDAQCSIDVNNRKKEISSLDLQFAFEKKNANYARELHFYSLPKGSDYVDMAKLYRKIVKDEGRFLSLDEKIKQSPDVEKLIGSVIWKHNVYSKERPKGVEKGYSLYIRREKHNIYEGLPNNWTAKEIFDEAKKKGFDKVCVYNTGWNDKGFDSGYPKRLPPNPERGSAKDFKNAAEYARSLSENYIYSVHDNYMDCYKNSDDFDSGLMVQSKNGTIKQGGIWRGGRAYIMCTSQSIKYAERDMPEIVKMLGKGSIYIDVLGCTFLESCHNPEHPQGKRNDVESRRRLLEYIKSVVGSVATEGIPPDYMANIVDLGAFAGIYLGYFASPAIEEIPKPVPLWQLVYHDSVLSYTSEDAYGIYGSEYILYCALFGMLPTQFDETSKKLSFELREAYRSEMLSHEFLEPMSIKNEDDCFFSAGVQKTKYSNGTVVVANFNETPYEYEGRLIKERDFLIINK